MKTYVRKRLTTTVLASAAMLAATVVQPQQAKADATLAAVLGGTALIGLLFHANQPMSGAAPRAGSPYSPYTMLSHPGYYGLQSAMPSYPYQSYAPVVYSSVAPVAMQQRPMYRVQQPVNYQVTAPTAAFLPQAPQQSVYHSSANMSYPTAPAGMAPAMQQPVQAQQMSYQPQYGMGVTQPQYGTTYPQY